MIGVNLPKNRKFNIEFQYYDPKKDEREGRRIKFQRGRASKHAAKQRNIIWLVVLLVMVIFFIKYLIGLGTGGT